MNNYINHIAFLIDKSGSIKNAGLEASIVKVFNGQIGKLKTRSKELEQETRVSVYLFNEKVECLFFDTDVNKIPSLASHYKAGGDTAMIDGMFTVVSDLKKTNELYGDHSYLIYCLTDGENRINNHLANKLNKEITSLPENWTVAALVPDQDGVHECKKFGFPKDNVKVWSVSASGLSEVSNTMSDATDSYMVSRSRGIRGTKSLFTVSTKNIDKSKIKQAHLEELSPKNYSVIPVYKDSPIKDYVESWLGDYVVGSAYYQLMKPETIQGHKNVIITDKVNGKAYIGEKARKLLQLPNFDVKVNPDMNGKYNLYVQSTSSNRRLIKGTQLIVLK